VATDAEISAPSSVPMEALGQAVSVHYDARAPIEWLQTASLSAELPVEFTLEVYADYPATLDWTTPSFVTPTPTTYVWAESDLVDIRRYCRYPPYGTAAVVFPEPWVFRYYLALEA